MSEFMTGEELRNEFVAVCGGARYAAMPVEFQLSWDAYAARIKCPRPKVPTLEETYDEWCATTRLGDNPESHIESLRQRLNAAHEARREANS